MNNDLDTLWHTDLLVWKEPDTWVTRLGRWIEPRLRKGGQSRLQRLGEQDLCWDDLDWRIRILADALEEDTEDTRDALANGLIHTTVRTYHGCRVPDAGVFHRSGLRINRPEELEDKVRRLVGEEDYYAWMRADIDTRIAEFKRRDRDAGWLHICLDDRVQLDDIGQYALYGSEWIQAFFGGTNLRPLRLQGVPTILELNLPLRLATAQTRKELADDLLQEWTRQIVNKPAWVPALDFTFSLDQDLPAEFVIGHHHPAKLRCVGSPGTELEFAL